MITWGPAWESRAVVATTISGQGPASPSRHAAVTRVTSATLVRTPHQITFRDSRKPLTCDDATEQARVCPLPSEVRTAFVQVEGPFVDTNVCQMS